ncbi:hypothetical protein PITC_033510 [Penicillium italicum]|uniref:Uncharacterized protein n=1 Tax=Penicillium italicum TaxID=40296 RepID=A0A0A2L6Q5_PENIT|nr:hypothetical protein PITC_033510 [Penicillium italicum]
MEEVMGQQLLPFVKYYDKDRILTIEGDSTVDAWVDDTVYNVLFTITRAADDPHTRPCTIHWDPVEDGCSQSGTMLIYHGDEGLQLKEVDPEKLPTKLLIPRQVTALDHYFKELVPGSSVSWKALLPSVHFEDAGPEVTYSMLWPVDTLVPESPPVVLPGLAYQSFVTLNYESDPEYFEDPPPPSPRAISPSARVNGAPVFSVRISGPATLSMKDQASSIPRHPLTVTVSYDARAELPHSGKPLTFRSFISKQPGATGFTERVPLNVGRNDGNNFWTLKPGEFWSFTREVREFPNDAAPGDRFGYLFKGATLDWWNWGSLEDHEDTVVWVPGWLVAKVQDPRDNDGRPKIVVPASNAVEFTLVN